MSKLKGTLLLRLNFAREVFNQRNKRAQRIFNRFCTFIEGTEDCNKPSVTEIFLPFVKKGKEIKQASYDKEIAKIVCIACRFLAGYGAVGFNVIRKDKGNILNLRFEPFRKE